MFYHTGFNPFQPPRPPPQPAAEPKKPGPPPGPPAPARMAIMVGGGKEAILALPPNLTQAIQAVEKAFEIPNTFVPRLAVKDVPVWLQKFKDQDTLFIADDPSYQYCIAGRQVVRFEVMVYPKDQPAAPAKPAPSQGSSCPIDLILETSKGQAFQLLASAQTEKDLSKGAPVGTYSGTLRITNNPLKIEFVGKQM